MTTEERIEDLVELVGDGDLYRYEASEMIVELLEKFAIGFAEWLQGNCCNIESDRYLYEDDQYKTNQLLEIYKKEKGL